MDAPVEVDSRGNGILAVRAAYLNLDTCYANVQAMIANYGQMNPRQTIVP